MNDQSLKLLADNNYYIFGDFNGSWGKQFLYVRTREFISEPVIFKAIVDQMAEMTKELNPDVVAGMVTAGVPWAAGIALKLGLPLIYVRKEKSERGLKRAVEGILKPGQKVLIVDDATGDGRSKEIFIKNILDEGGKVSDILSIGCADYPLTPFYDQNGIKLHSLAGHNKLVDYMEENGYYSKQLADWTRRHFEIVAKRSFTGEEMAEVKKLVLAGGREWYE